MGNYTCLLNEKHQNELIEGQSLDEQLQRIRIDRQFYLGQFVLWKQKNKGYIFSKVLTHKYYKKVTSSIQTTDHEIWHEERCSMDHKHLLKYYGLTYEYLSFSNLSETEIYFEFPTDTLHNYMTDYSKRGIFIPEQKIWSFISQIVDLMSYLHQKGYYHSCIDPRSFFLTEGDQLKTLYSRAYNDLISSYTKLFAGIENVGYMSPQQVVNFKNNIPDQGDPFKSDSFHFGLLILEMMSNKSGYKYLQLDFYNKENSSIAFSRILHDLITCRSRYSVKLIQFVQSLLIFEESQRPIIPQMRNSMIIQVPQQFQTLNYQPVTKQNLSKTKPQHKTEFIPQQTTISTPKITAISDRINKFLTPQIKTHFLSPVRVYSPSLPRTYTKTFLGVSPIRNHRNQTSPIIMSPKVIQFQFSPQNSPQQIRFKKPDEMKSQNHSNQQTVKKVQMKHVNTNHLEQTRQRQH